MLAIWQTEIFLEHALLNYFSGTVLQYKHMLAEVLFVQQK